MNPWKKIDRHIRMRRRMWLAGRIVLVVASVAVLVAVGWAWCRT